MHGSFLPSSEVWAPCMPQQSVPFAGSQDGCWEFLPVQLAGYLLAPSLNNGWVSILLFCSSIFPLGVKDGIFLIAF